MGNMNNHHIVGLSPPFRYRYLILALLSDLSFVIGCRHSNSCISVTLFPSYLHSQTSITREPYPYQLSWDRLPHTSLTMKSSPVMSVAALARPVSRTYISPSNIWLSWIANCKISSPKVGLLPSLNRFADAFFQKFYSGVSPRFLRSSKRLLLA